MKAQNYKNHIRYYPAHHFVFYPVALMLTFVAGYKAIKAEGELQSIWLFILLLLILIIWVSFMLRQHYALTLQNRLVRLEMRHKYSMLTGKDFEPIEAKLSFGQIAALRFAPDEELVPLVMRAVKENLSPKTIKESIINWKADERRV
ncbi:MAG TPA: DUF6526 family protein [Niabella sp.]|nr:DUF6526 family protein [Niabella sp.]